jgi:ATP-dependent Lon protease
LEALDPNLNGEFTDHYLEVPFDLGDILFIATANTVDGLIPALRDRLEIVPFLGYSDREKAAIFEACLWPKALRDHGLSPEIQLTSEAKDLLVRECGDEAGLRSLEQCVGQICRKIARWVVSGSTVPSTLTRDLLESEFGFKPNPPSAGAEHQIGVCMGLAVSERGGACLEIETVCLPSLRAEAELRITGNLGEVMRESALAAMSLARLRAAKLGIQDRLQQDVHLHIGEGGIAKDGPSAGLAVGISLWSALSQSSLPRNVAAIGELTLSGRLRPVGSVRAKLMAARRAGIETVIVPAAQKSDVSDCPEEVLEELKIVFAETFEEALAAVGLP